MTRTYASMNEKIIISVTKQQILERKFSADVYESSIIRVSFEI